MRINVSGQRQIESRALVATPEDAPIFCVAPNAIFAPLASASKRQQQTGLDN